MTSELPQTERQDSTESSSAEAVSPRISGRFKTPIGCALAGICIAGAVPPWGFWPLAFIGFAILDQLLIGTTSKQRFRRGWLTTAWWLFPAMLWMFDLTAPGYVVASMIYGCYFGLACVLTPPAATARRLVLPGAFAVAELVRWYWPFGGVPLANIALGQVDSPLAPAARLAGPLLIIVLVVAIGQLLSSLVMWNRDGSPRQAAYVAGITLAVVLGAGLHPRAADIRDVDVALVQGGGPTRTRASADQEPVVLARHIEATAAAELDVDLILWPENVVNPGRYLPMDVAEERVARVAIDNDATLLPGWFHGLDGTANTVNYHTAITPEGVTVDRYDKVRIVPFGEYVPFRNIVEKVYDGLPGRDVLPGTGSPTLDTPLGIVGVSISWEAYFERRSRDAVANGAQLLTNPTNGSSFWLTQVHTQQVASNQLRAIENDRWLLMVGPTGLSAVITPDGEVQQRTDIGERNVLTDTVTMRTGRTLSSQVGPWPVLLYGLAGLLVGLRSAIAARSPQQDDDAEPTKD